ncbi:MAG: hypothetical protein JXX29_16130 [Deltaproteobacteria bacterium]|nr:hypothetical protein [Deltaproteobacteria bacterium]MBN2673211.1 hypothetical protein [Deltaproteobacteria bacterium]
MTTKRPHPPSIAHQKRKGVHRALYIVLPLLAFLYIRVMFDFRQLHHDRRRPFLFDTEFIEPFLRYVAGPVDCLASLITQLYIYPWVGALTLFTLLGIIYFTTRVILRSFGQPPRFVSMLPAVVGLFLLQQHITVFPLASFAFSLSMAAVCTRCKSFPMVFRLVLFLVLSAFTAYIGGGTVLLLAGICALNELINHRQRILATAFIFLGAFIPFALGVFLYEPNRTLQYFIATPLEPSSPELHPFELCWYALIPLTIVATVFANRLRPLFHRAIQTFCILIFAAICIAMVNHRFYRYRPQAMNYYAENEEWNAALAYANRFPSEATIITAHIVNHALYHTERLPHDMFDYPQFRSGRVLLLGGNELDSLPHVANRRSDVYYRLGRIDQAERWTHEMLTSQGFLGHALHRLVAINVLKDRPKAARVYAGVMEKTVTHCETAAALIAAFQNGTLERSIQEANRIRPLLPKTDYVGEWTTRDILFQQLQEAPANRMAFEYLMAQFLITGNLKEFGQNVHRVKEFGYREIPRAYEEACVSYILATGKQPPNLDIKVQQYTIQKFARFQELYRQHHQNRRDAWEALKPEFGNTYWFFDLFGRTGLLSPPDFDTKETSP